MSDTHVPYYGTYTRLRVRVSATPRAVIFAASRKLKPRARFDRAQRDARHAFYRAMLAHHSNAGALCRAYRF
jgi:hypothetical protein